MTDNLKSPFISSMESVNNPSVGLGRMEMEGVLSFSPIPVQAEKVKVTMMPVESAQPDSLMTFTVYDCISNPMPDEDTAMDWLVAPFDQ